MRSAMLSACEACHIQWKKPFKGFEHLVVARKPKMRKAENFYESGMTAATRKSIKPKRKSTKPLVFIGSVTASIAVTALASFLYFNKRLAVENRAQAPDEASPNQDSTPKGAPSGIPPKAEKPVAPTTISVAKASEAKATDVSPTPAIPPASIPITPTVARRPVSPPLLLENNTPSSIVIPPELAGKQVRGIVKVGEDGKVIGFRVLDRGLTPVETRIATAIAMNMVFSPALAEDGGPVVSEISVSIAF